MEDIKDFETFYSIKIEPFLDELKAQEKSASKWGRIAMLSVVLGILSVMAIYYDLIADSGPVLVILSLLLLGYSVYNYTKEKESYADNFKSKIMKEIIDFLGLGIIYKPGDCISKKDYKMSGLYRQIYGDYSGSDYLEGTYKNISFQCSELYTEYDSSDVPPNVDQLKIFKGLFFVAKVSQNFTGGTYVWTRGEEQLAASIMDEEYRLMHLPSVTKYVVSNKDFNRYFSVCTTFPSQARSIINDGMIDQFVRFRNQLRRNFQFSVVAGKCYVAIPFDEDLLVPNSTEVENKEQVKQYFFTILLVLSIINQLQLTRLVD